MPSEKREQKMKIKMLKKFMDCLSYHNLRVFQEYCFLRSSEVHCSKTTVVQYRDGSYCRYPFT